MSLRRLPVLLFALTLAGIVPAATDSRAAKPATRLDVFAAASLADAFKEIAHTLEKQQPGLSIRYNFAGSQQLATQIEQGARADVFASADDRWMAYVRDRQRLAADPVPFARNRLVMIVPKTNPARIRKLEDLTRPGIKLVVGADAVPIGHYTRIVLRHLGSDPMFGGEFTERALRNVVSEEENVRSVVGKVQLGEADAGFVYVSDVTPSVARFVRAFPIPEAANVIATYPIAILRDAPESAAARRFVDYVLSPAGQATLERNQFLKVATPAP